MRMYVIFIGLLLGSMSCGREGNEADAQQLARINKDLGALEARVETLNKQLETLQARMERIERREIGAGQIDRGQAWSEPTPDDLAAADSDQEGTKEGAVTVDLGPPKQGPQLMVVTIGDDILVDGKPVSEADLAAKLREHAKRGAEGQLLIRAGTNVSPVRLMRLIDLAKQSGVIKFALVNESIPPAQAPAKGK